MFCSDFVLWFPLPVLLAESSHQIFPLVTSRLCEPPNICIHIPHGDSAMNPTLWKALTLSPPIVLVSCCCSQQRFAHVESLISTFVLPRSSLILDQWFPSSAQESQMSYKAVVGHHSHLVPPFYFQFKVRNHIVICRKFGRLTVACRSKKTGNQCSSSYSPSAVSFGTVWCHQQNGVSLDSSRGMHKACQYAETHRNLPSL